MPHLPCPPAGGLEERSPKSPPASTTAYRQLFHMGMPTDALEPNEGDWRSPHDEDRQRRIRAFGDREHHLKVHAELSEACQCIALYVWKENEIGGDRRPDSSGQRGRRRDDSLTNRDTSCRETPHPRAISASVLPSAAASLNCAR